MRPENTTAIIRPALSVMANEYDVDKAAKKFIAMIAAPKYDAPAQLGQFPIMNRENFKKRAETARGSGGKFNRIHGEFGNGTYNCEDHGLEYPIDDRKRAQYSNLFDAEVAGTKITRFQMLLNREYRVSQAYANAGLSNTNVAVAWSTVATGVPLTDIETGFEALEDNTGWDRSDMTVIIPRADFKEALLTDQVINKSKYTFRLADGVQPSQLSAAQFAAMLDCKQVLVPKGTVDSKEEGVTESNSQLWAAGVIYIVILAEEADDLDTPSFMRMVLNVNYTAEAPIVETYRDETCKADIVRMEEDTDELLQGETDLFGYKLTNT